MIKFIHKRMNGRDLYYPDCPKSKALLGIFGFDVIQSKEAINILNTVLALEIYEFPVRKECDPYKNKRKKND